MKRKETVRGVKNFDPNFPKGVVTVTKTETRVSLVLNWYTLGTSFQLHPNQFWFPVNFNFSSDNELKELVREKYYEWRESSGETN